MSTFTNFDLDEKILKALTEIGFQKPTPIQELAIPKVLEGLDIIASAQTGTGKTAAFMLPILHTLTQSSPKLTRERGPQILILVPTRELAIQISEESKKFARYLPRVKTVCVYGGVPYPPQRRALTSPYDILVATPGRLMDHMERGVINLSRVKMVVLDEADRMLDMGFIQDIEHIIENCPESRQTLLFSATIDRKIIPISKKFQNNPFEIKVEVAQSNQNNIEQQLYYTDGIGHKMKLLEHILENTEIHQSIIFTSTIHQANELAEYLQDKGYLSAALHGDMNQQQRSRTIDRLRRGKFRFLIATDVAARGIDVASLSHVINFDLPFRAEDFIHRIGRTGRAGAKGVAITFTTYKEEARLSKIHKLMGKSITQHTIAGMEPKPREQRSKAPSRHAGSRSRFRDRDTGSLRSREDRGPNSFKPREDREVGSFRPREDREFATAKPRRERDFAPKKRIGSPPGARPKKLFS